MALIMDRRGFLATPLAAFQLAAAVPDDTVQAHGDGLALTPQQYSQLLATLTPAGRFEPDDYSRGGVVEQLEIRMAALLGKETAVWLPTGTLANHLAVRVLAGTKRRVLVQAESHLFNDTGDCAETLSGLTLVPLGPGRGTFTAEEAEQAAAVSLLGRVATPVGAIQIESPVRRRLGEQFDFAQTQNISGWARSHGIGLHLDGARLFIESAYSRRPVRDYAALFDTVYISMYKYFNAASGAILAGPKSLLGDLYQTRRMFGGGLQQVWPFAAVALHCLDGFEQRFRSAIDLSERVLAQLGADSNFAIERVPNGTNVFRLRVFNVNAPVYQERLEGAGVSARAPAGEWFTMQVNETWSRVSVAELVARFRKGLG